MGGRGVNMPQPPLTNGRQRSGAVGGTPGRGQIWLRTRLVVVDTIRSIPPMIEHRGGKSHVVTILSSEGTMKKQ